MYVSPAVTGHTPAQDLKDFKYFKNEKEAAREAGLGWQTRRHPDLPYYPRLILVSSLRKRRSWNLPSLLVKVIIRIKLEQCNNTLKLSQSSHNQIYGKNTHIYYVNTLVKYAACLLSLCSFCIFSLHPGNLLCATVGTKWRNRTNKNSNSRIGNFRTEK